MIVLLIRIIVVIVRVISRIAAVSIAIVLAGRVPSVTAIIWLTEANIIVVAIAIGWQQR